MGISNTFNISGSALSAQSLHMNMIASNMANAQVVSGSENTAYRAQKPLFSAILDASMEGQGVASGVRVDGFAASQAQIERQRMPEHPLADAEGYVYLSNVNIVEEMADMMKASRTYQSNIEVLNTAKQLLLRTLSLGS